VVSLRGIKCSLPILLKLPRESVEPPHYANPLNRVLRFYKPINLLLPRPFPSFRRLHRLLFCVYYTIFFYVSTTSFKRWQLLFFLSLVNLYKNLVIGKNQNQILLILVFFFKKNLLVLDFYEMDNSRISSSQPWMTIV